MADKKVEIYLSGGSSNTDPNASLGGVISSTLLVSQTVTYDTTAMSGVTLVNSSGLSSNVLHFDFALTTLGITENPQLLLPVNVDVSLDGSYLLLLDDGSGSLEVDVVAASLPASDEEQQITASTILHNLFDPVTSENSRLGDVNYRHLYFKNITIAQIDFAVSIYNQLNGMDYLEIGIENSTSGSVDTLLVDENTPPIGVTFSAPTTSLGATQLTALASGSVGVFFKRTVLALTDVSTTEDTALFAVTEIAS